MLDLVAQHATTILAILALLVAAAALTARWEGFSLWLLSTWHSLPLIGGVAWLARRQTPRKSGPTGQTGMSAMLALCSSYARYIRVLSRADYDNCMNYLRKAGDLGRRPFPPILWFVIFSMVIVEAVGFAYVLAGWTLPGASEVLQQAAAGAIGFLVAVILVFFTHWAGVEIYQSNQHRRDRREWIEAGRPRPLHGPDLSLNDPQSVDDREPGFRQRATRGPGKTTYLLTTVTVVMVAAIGLGAAYVRGQVLEQELVVEAAVRARALERFDLGLSAAATRERIAADKQVIQEEIAIKRKGGWGTLVVLVIIFFFLQLLGMFFGYRYSFNGRLSRDAHRALNADRFSSYSELVQYYDRIVDIAQSRLELLQQQLERRRAGTLSGGLGVAHYYSFRDYLQMRDAQRREKPIGGEPELHEATLAPVSPEAHSVRAMAAVAETEPAADAEPAAVPEAAADERARMSPAAKSIPLVQAEPAALRTAGGPQTRTGQPMPEAQPAAAKPPTLGAIDAHKLLEEAEALERRRAADRAARGASKAPRSRGPSSRTSEVG